MQHVQPLLLIVWLFAFIACSHAAPQQLVQPDALAAAPTPTTDNPTDTGSDGQRRDEPAGSAQAATARQVKITIPPASWAGICSPGDTSNIRFVVKAQRPLIDNVLLVNRTVYEQLALRPGQRFANSLPNPWLPLSCTTADISTCQRDSEKVPWAKALPNARWCIIVGNQAGASPLAVEMDVGWAAGVGPKVADPPQPTREADALNKAAGSPSGASRTSVAASAVSLAIVLLFSALGTAVLL